MTDEPVPMAVDAAVADLPVGGVPVNDHPVTPRLQVDTSDLKSTYANFCNANFTREEIVLNFGTNHDWDRSRTGVDVKLAHRIVLSPFAAKRVADMLVQLVRDYEQRHGKLA